MAKTSASELLDVVDLHDVVVDTLSRGEVHRLQLPHRSVHVLVFNSEKRLLLQKRSMQKDECAGMWDSSCAGHVEASQSYEMTVIREFEEELGVKLNGMPECLFKMKPTTGNGMEFAAIYRINHDGPFTAAEDEIDELEWFSAEQLDGWVAGENNVHDAELTTGFCEIWRRFRKLENRAGDKFTGPGHADNEQKREP